jgi:uncharacterized caspase-like protein
MEEGEGVRGKARRTAAALAASGTVLAGLILAGLGACVLDTPYEKYAIVYGVSDYQAGVNDLNYADDDAIAMQALLAGQGYQVVALRLDAAATKDNLQNVDIPAVAGLAQEQDLFVFYFSGHGGQYAAGAEQPGSDGYNEYIYLYDSSPTISGIELTFSDDQLVAAFAAIKARKKVIILDSCNSGGFIGNELEADGEPSSLVEGDGGIVDLAARAIRLYANFDGSTADIPPWEALVLSASGEREYSYESPVYPDMPLLYHGVFTFYLLEAASDGDLNHDGWVTVTEAFAYAQEMIYRYWNNTAYGFTYGYFSPHVSGGPVDYVLFEAPPP